ncbi:MAG: hypothetical protein IPJ79_19355 [Bacteroidetes bacterium]|nr:hypothetical protein [Bacteroidota bacterium]
MAPYKLTYKALTVGSDTFAVKLQSIPEASYTLFPFNNSKTSIASVDVVITPDKSKWTRCPVLETGLNSIVPTLNQLGGTTPPERFSMRAAPSVDKNGNAGDGVVTNDPNDADYISSTGMGWFPGYAVNIDNGERLNMAFGENSGLADQNGTDMIWNPTSVKTKDVTSTGGTTISNYLVAGGMHYVYVFGHNDDRPAKDVTRYDAGERLNTLIKGNNVNKRDAFKDAMWVTQAMTAPGNSFNGNIPPGEVEVKLRVAKKYRRFATTTSDTLFTGEVGMDDGVTYFVVGSVNATYNGVNYTPGSNFVAVAGVDSITGVGAAVVATINGANPLYEFEADDLLPTTNVSDVAVSALDKINVVPNPYYAYSSYDKTTNDQWVKITNLPANCVISIYTLNGTLVRRINRDEAADNSAGTAVSLTQGTEAGSGNTETSFDWDLKNQKNIPVSSGVYLIHISAPGVGEKTVKWFGMMRPIDLDSY